MTGLQLAMEAERLPASTRVGGFRHRSNHTQGVGEFDLWKVDDPAHLGSLGLDEVLLVTDSVGDRPQAVIGLKAVSTGDPIVELVQSDSGIDLNKDMGIVPKILDSTMVAIDVRRLRLGDEMTNVSGRVLAPNVSPDPSDGESNLLVFPRNQPAPSEMADLQERARAMVSEAWRPRELRPIAELFDLDAEAQARKKAKDEAEAAAKKDSGDQPADEPEIEAIVEEEAIAA